MHTPILRDNNLLTGSRLPGGHHLGVRVLQEGCPAGCPRDDHLSRRAIPQEGILLHRDGVPQRVLRADGSPGGTDGPRARPEKLQV